MANETCAETFTLPAMQDDEILARVVTDSLCLSSWKEANQGADHKRCQMMWPPAHYYRS